MERYRLILNFVFCTGFIFDSEIDKTKVFFRFQFIYVEADDDCPERTAISEADQSDQSETDETREMPIPDSDETVEESIPDSEETVEEPILVSDETIQETLFHDFAEEDKTEEDTTTTTTLRTPTATSSSGNGHFLTPFGLHHNTNILLMTCEKGIS